MRKPNFNPKSSPDYLSNELDHKMVQKYLKGDSQATEKIAGLVSKYAEKTSIAQHGKLGFKDLNISEKDLQAQMHAVMLEKIRDYNPEKSALRSHLIKSALFAGKEYRKMLVKQKLVTSENMGKKYREADAARNKLVEVLGREPESHEIAQVMQLTRIAKEKKKSEGEGRPANKIPNVSQAHVEKALALPKIFSLDAPKSRALLRSRTGYDELPDSQLGQEAGHGMLVGPKLLESIEKLPEREKAIVLAHHVKGMPFVEIAAITPNKRGGIGVTQARISAMYKKAIERLREMHDIKKP